MFANYFRSTWRKMPEVESAVATIDWGESYALSPIAGTGSVNQEDIKGVGIYAGANFFHVFSFHLIEGDPQQTITGFHGSCRFCAQK